MRCVVCGKKIDGFYNNHRCPRRATLAVDGAQNRDPLTEDPPPRTDEDRFEELTKLEAEEAIRNGTKLEGSLLMVSKFSLPATKVTPPTTGEPTVGSGPRVRPQPFTYVKRPSGRIGKARPRGKKR